MRKTIRADDVITVTRAEIAAMFELPFLDLVSKSHQAHLANHQANYVELATLLSIKTGGCPEDCGYCSQSASAQSGVKASKMLNVEAVLEAARAARDAEL